MPKTLRQALPLTLLALSAASTAWAQPLVLRQGSNSPPGTVFHAAWTGFKAALESSSQGALRVELNTAEPNEGNLLSNLRRGRTDCAGVSLQGAATVLPEVAVLQLPYLFNSTQEVDHVYGQPPLTQTYRRLFAAKGLHLLAWVEVGFVHLYGTQPLRTPADVKGLKLRATQSRASQQWVKATGAEPVVLAFGDLLPGLQTGLIRGGESGTIVYDAVINKAAPHYTLTAHAFDSGVVLCNKEWLDKLPPALARGVQDAWDGPGFIKAVRAQNDKLLADAGTRGWSVVRPNAAELAAWRALAPAAADAVMATLPPEAAALRQQIETLVKAAVR